MARERFGIIETVLIPSMRGMVGYFDTLDRRVTKIYFEVIFGWY